MCKAGRLRVKGGSSPPSWVVVPWVLLGVVRRYWFRGAGRVGTVGGGGAG